MMIRSLTLRFGTKTGSLAATTRPDLYPNVTPSKSPYSRDQIPPSDPYPLITFSPTRRTIYPRAVMSGICRLGTVSTGRWLTGQVSLSFLGFITSCTIRTGSEGGLGPNSRDQPHPGNDGFSIQLRRALDPDVQRRLVRIFIMPPQNLERTVIQHQPQRHTRFYVRSPGRTVHRWGCPTLHRDHRLRERFQRYERYTWEWG